MHRPLEMGVCLAQVSKFGCWLIKKLNNMWCEWKFENICIIDILV